jgi:hypothetical protein
MINEKLLIDRTKKYITLLNSKDLTGLDEMYYSYCTLKDWNVECPSKEAVLELNRKMFEGSTLDVSILDMDIVGNIVYCILWIGSGEERIKVLDCIHWIDVYPDGPRITDIRAFKLN